MHIAFMIAFATTKVYGCSKPKRRGRRRKLYPRRKPDLMTTSIIEKRPTLPSGGITASQKGWFPWSHKKLLPCQDTFKAWEREAQRMSGAAHLMVSVGGVWPPMTLDHCIIWDQQSEASGSLQDASRPPSRLGSMHK